MYGWMVRIINAEQTQSYSLYTIKKQTISKILKRSRYKLVKNAGKSFADFVSQE